MDSWKSIVTRGKDLQSPQTQPLKFTVVETEAQGTGLPNVTKGVNDSTETQIPSRPEPFPQDPRPHPIQGTAQFSPSQRHIQLCSLIPLHSHSGTSNKCLLDILHFEPFSHLSCPTSRRPPQQVMSTLSLGVFEHSLEAHLTWRLQKDFLPWKGNK
jgi:hypothetical protein